LATKFSLDQLGVIFQVKLTDCVTELPSDVSDVVSQTIVFYKPDGTEFSKTASLVADPDNAGQFFIQYQNTSPEASILDLLGNWEYAGAVVLNTSDHLQTSERTVFWVV